MVSVWVVGHIHKITKFIFSSHWKIPLSDRFEKSLSWAWWTWLRGWAGELQTFHITTESFFSQWNFRNKFIRVSVYLLFKKIKIKICAQHRKLGKKCVKKKNYSSMHSSLKGNSCKLWISIFLCKFLYTAFSFTHYNNHSLNLKEN